ncbi:hypothetical protein GPECTOR_30g269 [Gonium pectorale]|uniref:Protein-tyrosine-phosphatase n=1 Tax=Gonium pectorale TaxID=33097 RepID=A0A150GEG8_GONPE|nr:hypothetical protein GPECTOR_30g269 [Gonium pectorale]|eukprot:KXZ48173.1 hypothetical protein GPECTOR_30g269 [Gonium pectorale]
MHVPVYDLEEEDLVKHFRACFEFINAGREHGGVLVHCAAGISRSATVVIAWLMVHVGMTPAEARAAVKAARPAINPNQGFGLQLQLFHEARCSTEGWQPWNLERFLQVRGTAAPPAGLAASASDVHGACDVSPPMLSREDSLSPLSSPTRSQERRPSQQGLLLGSCSAEGADGGSGGSVGAASGCVSHAGLRADAAPVTAGGQRDEPGGAVAPLQDPLFPPQWPSAPAAVDVAAQPHGRPYGKQLSAGSREAAAAATAAASTFPASAAVAGNARLQLQPPSPPLASVGWGQASPSSSRHTITGIPDASATAAWSHFLTGAAGAGPGPWRDPLSDGLFIAGGATAPVAAPTGWRVVHGGAAAGGSRSATGFVAWPPRAGAGGSAAHAPAPAPVPMPQRAHSGGLPPPAPRPPPPPPSEPPGMPARPPAAGGELLSRPPGRSGAGVGEGGRRLSSGRSSDTGESLSFRPAGPRGGGGPGLGYRPADGRGGGSGRHSGPRRSLSDSLPDIIARLAAMATAAAPDGPIADAAAEADPEAGPAMRGAFIATTGPAAAAAAPGWGYAGLAAPVGGRLSTDSGVSCEHADPAAHSGTVSSRSASDTSSASSGGGKSAGGLGEDSGDAAGSASLGTSPCSDSRGVAMMPAPHDTAPWPPAAAAAVAAAAGDGAWGAGVGAVRTEVQPTPPAWEAGRVEGFLPMPWSLQPVLTPAGLDRTPRKTGTSDGGGSDGGTPQSAAAASTGAGGAFGSAVDLVSGIAAAHVVATLRMAHGDGGAASRQHVRTDAAIANSQGGAAPEADGDDALQAPDAAAATTAAEAAMGGPPSRSSGDGDDSGAAAPHSRRRLWSGADDAAPGHSQRRRLDHADHAPQLGPGGGALAVTPPPPPSLPDPLALPHGDAVAVRSPVHLPPAASALAGDPLGLPQGDPPGEWTGDGGGWRRSSATRRYSEAASDCSGGYDAGGAAGDAAGDAAGIEGEGLDLLPNAPFRWSACDDESADGGLARPASAVVASAAAAVATSAAAHRFGATRHYSLDGSGGLDHRPVTPPAPQALHSPESPLPPPSLAAALVSTGAAAWPLRPAPADSPSLQSMMSLSSGANTAPGAPLPAVTLASGFASSAGFAAAALAAAATAVTTPGWASDPAAPPRVLHSPGAASAAVPSPVRGGGTAAGRPPSTYSGATAAAPPMAGVAAPKVIAESVSVRSYAEAAAAAAASGGGAAAAAPSARSGSTGASGPHSARHMLPPSPLSSPLPQPHPPWPFSPSHAWPEPGRADAGGSTSASSTAASTPATAGPSPLAWGGSRSSASLATAPSEPSEPEPVAATQRQPPQPRQQQQQQRPGGLMPVAFGMPAQRAAGAWADSAGAGVRSPGTGAVAAAGPSPLPQQQQRQQPGVTPFGSVFSELAAAPPPPPASPPHTMLETGHSGASPPAAATGLSRMASTASSAPGHQSSPRTPPAVGDAQEPPSPGLSPHATPGGAQRASPPSFMPQGGARARGEASSASPSPIKFSPPETGLAAAGTAAEARPRPDPSLLRPIIGRQLLPMPAPSRITFSPSGTPRSGGGAPPSYSSSATRGSLRSDLWVQLPHELRAGAATAADGPYGSVVRLASGGGAAAASSAGGGGPAAGSPGAGVSFSGAAGMRAATANTHSPAHSPATTVTAAASAPGEHAARSPGGGAASGAATPVGGPPSTGSGPPTWLLPSVRSPCSVGDPPPGADDGAQRP